MAEITIPSPWDNGTTVNVWPAVAQSDLSGQPHGTPVAQGVAAAGVVAFDGLEERVQYVAYATNVSRRFVVSSISDVPSSVGERMSALEVSLDALEGKFEVSIHDYADLNTVGGADASAIINQAIVDVSTAAIAAGVQGTLTFPRAPHLRIDSSIIPKSKVTLQLDDARIFAGADLPLMGMIRAVPPAQQPALAIGTATTTNGSNLLTNVSAPRSYYEEMEFASTTGITTGTKVVAVRESTQTVTMDAPATASGTVAITRRATYYNWCEDFRVIGGELDANDKLLASGFRMIYMDRPQIIGTRFLFAYPSNQPQLAAQLGGRGGLVKDFQAIGGNHEFHDGIHIVEGQRWRVESCDVCSGDDMVAIGREGAAGSNEIGAEASPIRDVTVSTLTGRSNHAFVAKVYVRAGNTGRDEEVTDITFDGVAAHAGITENGVIRCRDYNDTAAGTSQIRKIRMSNMALEGGSLGHAATLEHELIHCWSVDDASFSHVTAKLTDGFGSLEAGPPQGGDVVRVQKSRDITVEDLTISAMPLRYGAYASDTIRFKLRDSTLIAGPATTVPPVRLIACPGFEIVGNNLEPASGDAAVWITGTGSYGKIRDNTAGNNAADCYLLAHTAAAVTYLDIGDNDITRCLRAMQTEVEWLTTVRARKEMVSAIPTIAPSAGVLTIPPQDEAGDDIWLVSGTGNITSVVATGYANRRRRVTLLFTGTAAGTGLTAGSNIKIPANFVYTPNDTYTLILDGTNAVGVGSSVNP